MRAILESQSVAGTGLQVLMREMLVRLGEDPERDGLRDTPERMERSIQYLTKGYQENLQEILLGAMFDVAYDEMVIVKDIEMFSLCEHHLLPFFGKVHVAYIPRGKVIGLSKVPRLVDAFARQLARGRARRCRRLRHGCESLYRRRPLEFSTPDTIPASNALPSSINSSTLSESTLSTLDKPSRSPDCSHDDFLRNAEDPSFWVAFGFFLLISLVDLRLSP